eukprot:15285521-Alexandrium_andersonii.AAC.1
MPTLCGGDITWPRPCGPHDEKNALWCSQKQGSGTRSSNCLLATMHSSTAPELAWGGRGAAALTHLGDR